MAYVIASPCVADFSCVDICPVSAIAPGPDSPYFDTVEQLYIDPATCIDCGACLDVCPVSAIFPGGSLPPKWAHYVDINRQFFALASK